MAFIHFYMPPGTWSSPLWVPPEFLLDNLVNAGQKLAPAVLSLAFVSVVLMEA